MNHLARVPAGEQLYGVTVPPGPLVERLEMALAHRADLEDLAALVPHLGDARLDVAPTPAVLAYLVVVDTLADITAAGYLTVEAAELLLTRLLHNADRRIR